MQQAVAGLPMSWADCPFKCHNQNSFATETGQEASTDQSGPRKWNKPQDCAQRKVLLLTFKKLIGRLWEKWLLEATLSFALHMHGDRIVKRVDSAVITRGYIQWPLSGDLSWQVFWQWVQWAGRALLFRGSTLQRSRDSNLYKSLESKAQNVETQWALFTQCTGAMLTRTSLLLMIKYNCINPYLMVFLTINYTDTKIRLKHELLLLLNEAWFYF